MCDLSNLSDKEIEESASSNKNKHHYHTGRRQYTSQHDQPLLRLLLLEPSSAPALLSHVKKLVL